MKCPRYFINALNSGAFATTKLEDTPLSQRRFDRTKMRHHKTEVNQAAGHYREAADISIVKTAFVPVERVTRRNVEHSLWAGTLSNGREQFVACIAHAPGNPRYTKAFAAREEAVEFFQRCIA